MDAPKPSRLVELAEQGALALRRQVKDLLAVLSMPEAWRVQAPDEIAAGLVELMVGVVQLDLASVRLVDEEGDISESFPAEVDWAQVEAALAARPADGPARIRLHGANALGRDEVRLLAVTPVGERGLVVAGSRRENFPTAHEELLVRAAADQAALAMQSSRQARAQNRLALERVQLERLNVTLARLHAISERLGRARSSTEVLEVAVAEGLSATGAHRGSAYLLDETGQLALVHSAGVGSELPRSVPLLANLPAAVAVRTASPVFLSAPAEVSVVAPPAAVTESLAVVPIQIEGRCLGALRFSFAEQRAFSSAERSFLLALGHQAAQAYDRARLLYAERHARLEAEARQRRTAVLSDASALLASMLENDGLATALAQLAISHMADLCLVVLRDASEDGREESVLARGDRPAPERVVQRRTHPPLDAPSAIVSELSVEKDLAAAFPAVADRERLREAGARSAVVAPVVARGRALGLIAFAAFDPGRFGKADLDLLEELGRRAGLAIENARLYWQARLAEQRKDEFLAMLGHELRNPLAPIRTALQLMRMRGTDAFSKERGVIERQMDHVVRLVDDLLDVSRITRGKIDLKREAVEIGAVVAKAIEMTSPLFERASHHLVIGSPGAPLWVMGDSGRLAQVVANLLNNAAKYTERGGRISVSAGREGDSAMIRVRDTGIGIAAEVLPRVFDIFVQDRRATDRAQGGLGLGLTIVRSLVELHGGQVEVTSEGPGRGSEFVVRLPALAEATHLAGEAQPLAALPRPDLVRVLVVDDNADAGEMVADALSTAGYEALVVHDGPAALEAARQFKPDVGLLDIGLPVMDGYELAERLRREHESRGIRLVAITGYGQHQDREQSRRAGFDVHLVKPLDLDQLLDVLSQLHPQRGSDQQTGLGGRR